MKKILLLLAMTFCLLPLPAQKAELSKSDIKEFNERMEDVDTSIKDRIFIYPSDFWTYVRSHNKPLLKYEKKDSRLRRKVRDELSGYRLECDIMDKQLVKTALQGSDVDSLTCYLSVMLSGTEALSDSIHIIPSDAFDVFINDSGNIYITEGVCRLLAPDELMFVVAHEYTHYLLKHIEVEMYRQKKEAFRDKMISGVVGGLAVAGVVYGVASDSDVEPAIMVGVDIGIAGIGQVLAKRNALLPGFSYSSAQEAESDFVAYQFMKNYSEVGAIESALEKLYANTAQTPRGVDSPCCSHQALLGRIKFVRYLESNELPSMEDVRNDSDEVYGR